MRAVATLALALAACSAAHAPDDGGIVCPPDVAGVAALDGTSCAGVPSGTVCARVTCAMDATATCTGGAWSVRIGFGECDAGAPDFGHDAGPTDAGDAAAPDAASTDAGDAGPCGPMPPAAECTTCWGAPWEWVCRSTGWECPATPC